MTSRKIRKRDGALAAFDERKLEHSILQAAQRAGQENPRLARDLAAVVSTYVDEHYGQKVATSQDLRSMVHKVLQDTGYPEIARTYQTYSKPRADGQPADLFPQDLLVIDASTRDEIERWDKDRIRRALVADGVAEAQAAAIAEAVERDILSLRLSRVSTTFVRELVGRELGRQGIRAPLENHRILGIPKADLQQWLSQPAATDPETMCTRLGELTLKQYALQELFTREVADAHLEGRIHIHNLENPFKFYWGRIPWKALGEPLSHADIRMDLARRHFAEALEVGPVSLDAVPAWAGTAFPRVIVESCAAGEPAFAGLRRNVILARGAEADSSVIHRAAQRGETLFAFEGGSRFGGADLLVVGQAVSVNLPRVARRSTKIFDELEASVELAIQAHVQKREVLAGFLHALAPMLRVAVPPLSFTVGVQGLNEMILLMTGRELGSDEETIRAGHQVLSYAHGLVRESGQRHRLSVSLGELFSFTALERFTRLDSRLHSTAGGASPGYHLPASDRPDLARRLAVESRLGTLVEGAAVLVPRDLRPKISSEALGAFLGEASRDPRVRRVLVV